MALWEIINPSDPYCFRTEDLQPDDHEIAAQVISLLGEGKYIGNEHKGQRRVPPFPFGGHDEWFKENFGRDFAESLTFVTSDPARCEALAAALESVTLGRPDEVEERFALADAMPVFAGNRASLVAETQAHNARRRSSLNDIGKRAAQWAVRIRELAAEKAAVRQ